MGNMGHELGSFEVDATAPAPPRDPDTEPGPGWRSYQDASVTTAVPSQPVEPTVTEPAPDQPPTRVG